MLKFLKRAIAMPAMRSMYMPFVRILNERVFRKVNAKYPEFSGYAFLEYGKDRQIFKIKTEGGEHLPQQVVDYINIVPAFVEGLIKTQDGEDFKTRFRQIALQASNIDPLLKKRELVEQELGL